jgi:hypothetical protein
MIKHDEVREMVIWGRIIHQDTEKARETLLDYIAEQEKKDELLGLYRELLRLDKSIRNTMLDIEKYNLFTKMTEVRKKIKALEEELK